MLQGSRIVQRYIDYKKLQRLMKDISGFTASQRMEPGQPAVNIDAKQVSVACLAYPWQRTWQIHTNRSNVDFAMLACIAAVAPEAAHNLSPVWLRQGSCMTHTVPCIGLNFACGMAVRVQHEKLHHEPAIHGKFYAHEAHI